MTASPRRLALRADIARNGNRARVHDCRRCRLPTATIGITSRASRDRRHGRGRWLPACRRFRSGLRRRRPSQCPAGSACEGVRPRVPADSVRFHSLSPEERGRPARSTAARRRLGRVNRSIVTSSDHARTKVVSIASSSDRPEGPKAGAGRLVRPTNSSVSESLNRLGV